MPSTIADFVDMLYIMVLVAFIFVGEANRVIGFVELEEEILVISDVPDVV